MDWIKGVDIKNYRLEIMPTSGFKFSQYSSSGWGLIVSEYNFFYVQLRVVEYIK